MLFHPLVIQTKGATFCKATHRKIHDWRQHTELVQVYGCSYNMNIWPKLQSGGFSRNTHFRFWRMSTGRMPCFFKFFHVLLCFSMFLSTFRNDYSSCHPVTWPFLRGKQCSTHAYEYGYGCTPKTGILRSLLPGPLRTGRFYGMSVLVNKLVPSSGKGEGKQKPWEQRCRWRQKAQSLGWPTHPLQSAKPRYSTLDKNTIQTYFNADLSIKMSPTPHPTPANLNTYNT